MAGSLHGVVDEMDRDELVISSRGKLTVDLNMRLNAVWSVLKDDLLIDGLVCSFDRAGIHGLVAPEVPLGVERFVKVARVAAGVGERHPEAVWRVLGKEARCHLPDGVRNTACLVKHQQHAVEVVNACVGVGVLFRPQAALDAPVARALLQVALDQFSQPLGGHDTGSRDLKPV